MILKIVLRWTATTSVVHHDLDDDKENSITYSFRYVLHEPSGVRSKKKKVYLFKERAGWLECCFPSKVFVVNHNNHVSINDSFGMALNGNKYRYSDLTVRGSRIKFEEKYFCFGLPTFSVFKHRRQLLLIITYKQA